MIDTVPESVSPAATVVSVELLAALELGVVGVLNDGVVVPLVGVEGVLNEGVVMPLVGLVPATNAVAVLVAAEGAESPMFDADSAPTVSL